MLRALEHRGPDGSGSWSEPKLGFHFGMRRLSIIDLEGGQQPIWNEDRTIGIVFNGEIYNYIELRQQLETAGHHFTTQSDTEVLVHLYERDGEAMFSCLRGMFGLAIYDSRQRQLLVARDQAGQKPFFYYHDTNRFAFASEIKALLTLPFVPDEPNPDAFLDYLAWSSLPAPLTHFRHISKLPPSSYIKIAFDRPGDFDVRPYTYQSTSPDSPLSDPEEAVAQLDARLRESAMLHLRADVPIGIMLSSGMDSQTIASYMQEVHPQQVCSFTADFQGGASEINGATASAHLIHSNHFPVPIQPGDLADSLPKIAWHLDEPINDPAAFAVHKVCEFARSHVKVLLGGEGADELFAGYENRYQGIMETVERSNRIRKWAGWLPHSLSAPNSTAIGRFLRRSHLTEGEETVALRMEGFPGDIRNPIELIPQHYNHFENRASYYSQITYAKNKNPLETLLHLDRCWELPEVLLAKADRMSMAASIELRSPFLDAEIQKLADRMGMGLKLPTAGAGKWILFKCLQRRFPGFKRREKQGFPVPLSAWLAGPLRRQIESELFDTQSALSRLIDPARLRAAWDAFHQGRCPAYFIYGLWLYNTWQREFSKRIHYLKTGP